MIMVSLIFIPFIILLGKESYKTWQEIKRK